MRRPILTQLLCLALGLSYFWPAYAAKQAEPLRLTLRNAIMLGLRHNPNVRAAEIQRIADKYALAVAKWAFKPQYKLTGSAERAATVTAGVKAQTQDYNATAETSIKTKMGTTYSLTFDNPNDGQFYNPKLTLQIKQPLFKGRDPEVVQRTLNDALDSEEVNKLTLKSAIESAVTTIIKDYRALIQAKNELVIQKLAQKNAKENLKTVKAKIKAGNLPKTESYQTELDVERQRLSIAQAKNTLDQARQQLLNDIGVDASLPVRVKGNVRIGRVIIPTLDQSLVTAFNYNVDYKQARINLNKTKRGLLVAKDNLNWDVNLTATATRGGGTGGGKNEEISSLFNGENRSRSVGFELGIPIDDLSLEEAVASAKVSLDRAKLDLHLKKITLERQVRNDIINIRSEVKQIASAERSVVLAKQSLKAEIKRQEYGRSSALAVATSRTNLVNLQLELVRSKIAYLNALTDFHQRLGDTLAIWGIELQY